MRAECRPLARSGNPLPRGAVSRGRHRRHPPGTSGKRPQDPGGAVRGEQHNGPVPLRLPDRRTRRETGGRSGRVHPERCRGGEAIWFRDLDVERLSAPEGVDLRRRSTLREGAGSASPSQPRRLLHGGAVGASDGTLRLTVPGDHAESRPVRRRPEDDGRDELLQPLVSRRTGVFTDSSARSFRKTRGRMPGSRVPRAGASEATSASPTTSASWGTRRTSSTRTGGRPPASTR